jgi:formylglycine-generating enzyme required for sulfatase activity
MRPAVSAATLAAIAYSVHAAPPAGYRCAPGTAKPGVGCTCPATHVEKRDAENTATCVAKAAPPTKCPSGMQWIPGGTFKMGSANGDGEPEERPQHDVTLSSFCMDRTEVTVGAYQKCVAAGVCAGTAKTVQWSGITADQAKTWGPRCNAHRKDRADHPINCVDFSDALAFCAWAKKRLPTESEWEYAARGKDGRRYPWGSAPPDSNLLNACGSECGAAGKRLGEDWAQMYTSNDGWEQTSPVGSYPAGASPFGVLDMAGNVWEWTSDWDGPYPTNALTNPRGPVSATNNARQTRGGGWYEDSTSNVRTAARSADEVDVRSAGVGFRCAKSD